MKVLESEYVFNEKYKCFQRKDDAGFFICPECKKMNGKIPLPIPLFFPKKIKCPANCGWEIDNPDFNKEDHKKHKAAVKRYKRTRNALKQDFKFIHRDDGLYQEGICPNCGQKELFVPRNGPWRVQCARVTCNYSAFIKELYPDLWNKN